MGWARTCAREGSRSLAKDDHKIFRVGRVSPEGEVFIRNFLLQRVRSRFLGAWAHRGEAVAMRQGGSGCRDRTLV